MQTLRRTFLKNMAASTAAAPFIPPSRVWPAPTGPNGELTIGHIGIGGMGGNLIGHFVERKNCRVIAVCDVDTEHHGGAKKRVHAAYKNA